MKLTIVCLLLAAALLQYQPATAQQLITYDAPEGVAAAPDYELYINNKKVFVHNTRPAAYASFSFQGKVDIRIVCGAQIYSYDIRPLSKKIAASQYRNEIQFSLDQPGNISVEINKNIKRPLFLFANPLETSIPDRNSKQVIFYEAGKVHEPGIVKVKTDQWVYIEGGAIVKGSFIFDKASHARLSGRGIIDNSHYKRGEARPVEINESRDITIEGIVIAESKHWSCGSYASRNVLYDNLKVVSDNDWDDGIDIVGSQQIRIRNCFLRTKDDCIAIKSGVDYFSKFPTSFTVDSVEVSDCVFWNGVWGNALEIGFETRTDTIRNIVFRDCDIIHVEGPEGTFTIHNGDRALVQHVRYENIRVEDTRGYLIDFKILESQYSKDKVRGKIEDIVFKNIQVEGEHFPSSVLIGFDPQHLVRGILIDNITIHGRRVNSEYAGLIAGKFFEKLIFR